MAPTTQQAWIVKKKGVPKDALVFETEHPVKKPGRERALNPAGHKLMLFPNFLVKRPNHEDPNDSDFKQGEEVFGCIPIRRRLQQYACVPAANLVHKPDNVKFTEAAGFALAGETAWQAMFDCGHFEAGQTVFINGGSSAPKGARIVASASGKNEEFVRSLGADEFIDYTKRPLHEYLSENPPSPKFHLILDAVGLLDPTLFTCSPAYLAPGGTFVTVGTLLQGLHPFILGVKTLFAMIWSAWLGGVPRRHKTVYVQNNPTDLKQLQLLVKEGKLKSVVDSVYEFNDVHGAYERIMTSRARGKVVVKVDPSTT
ncbi:hypothetical protein CPB85DRAFT_1375611 [Mucidula mucida]|nr:hypothetical protein CPB85DRAFT_1375611 [Mucidula mucida]